MAELDVHIVSVEREIWSGDARQVTARTTEGDIGVLPGHAPLLGQLAEGGVVEITREGGEALLLAAHGGFLSVTGDGVSILAEYAELSSDIDVERARAAFERTGAADLDDLDTQSAHLRAQSRLRAAGQTV